MPSVVQRTEVGGNARPIAWNTKEAVYYLTWIKSSGGVATGFTIPLEIKSLGVAQGAQDYATSGLDGVVDGYIHYDFTRVIQIVGNVRAPYTAAGVQGITSQPAGTIEQVRDLTNTILNHGDVVKLKHADVGDPFTEMETKNGVDILWHIRNPSKLRQGNTVRTISFTAINPELNFQ